MSKEKKNTQNEKHKLSRQERKQIDTLIRQAKGDGKPHTAQDSIPFERMYKDGICRLANGRYSKCIEFEDINYQLAQPDDKTAIFEALCDMYNSFDASIGVQLSLISRHANKEDFKSSITIAPQNDDFDSIPKQTKIKKERVFDEAKGKAKTRLSFEKTDKPPNGKLRHNPLSRPAQELNSTVHGKIYEVEKENVGVESCLLYTSPSPRD